MTPAEHEKWLRKMGVHPEQLKERKKKRKKAYKPTARVSYYEDKPLVASPTFKGEEKKLDKGMSNLALRVYEESRTSPRDLGGDRDYTW